MYNHRCSVFKNSCLKIPIDPISKMPKTAYERTKRTTKQSSLDSVSTISSVSTADRDAEKLKDFYRSIPDYKDINHLPAEQFYSTLRSLREKKKAMLETAVEHIDDCPRHHHSNTIDSILVKTDYTHNRKPIHKQSNKSRFRRKYASEKRDLENGFHTMSEKLIESSDLLTAKASPTKKRSSSRKTIKSSDPTNYDPGPTTGTISPDKENIQKTDRPKRNQSSCSISWSDAKVESKTDIDRKFDQFFDGRKYASPHRVEIGDDFGTQSMPSSPLRGRKSRSPRRRRSITVPKPFKMTERDEDERIVDELRSLRKSFSDDMLHQKCERRQFRANPVPIESRIPLYDKILEDQAMRRAITKINCEADLRAQMKPFSFTKREEKGMIPCDRAAQITPKPTKKKRFKAKPFPKNLFSNYFYDKMKENEYFRGMNKRIRAEEMLKTANLPRSMAARERSRLSTPGAHSDLPIDSSPGASIALSDRRRHSSPVKGKKRDKKDEFITTSPQPFHFSTARRAAKKMEEITRKIYQESKSSESIDCRHTGEGPRAYSALDLRAIASGRSNLAAVLRAEAVRRKFEMDAARSLSEQRRKAEMKQRDRLFRSKPAWHLVKNNCEEDIAMRLQTRRDEERLRREEFLHEMELMYGRVQLRPMLFEQYYAPRSQSAPTDSIQPSPRKPKKKSLKKDNCYHFSSPNRSRKVSINDTAETFNGHVAEYLNRIDNDNDALSDSVMDSERDKL